MRRVAAATPVMGPEVVLVVHHVEDLDSGHFTYPSHRRSVNAKSRTCLLLAFVRSLSNLK
jgi:hypothetical protein